MIEKPHSFRTACTITTQGVSHRDICMLVPYNIGNCGTLVVNNMIQERIKP